MFALMRHAILSQPRACVGQFPRQSRINLCLSKRGLPASFTQDGHGFAARKMPRAKQDAPAWNLERRIARSGHVPGIDVPRMRHDAAEGCNFFTRAACELINIA